jgi:sulfate adenylyltransferase subunit 1 (EFTu-like GTPase family)
MPSRGIDGLTARSVAAPFIVSKLGVRRFVVAVNKMVLVDWSQSRVAELRAEFCTFLCA